MDPCELVELLSRPEAYPPPVEEVQLIQTHISLLFLAGQRVYKVKKPVDLGFLDYTTLEKREHWCREELRLNRRLSPDVYLGVAPIVADGRGGLRVDSRGTPVEWAVEMVRLPSERMLDALLERGEVDNQMLGDLARLLKSFHARCATGPGVDEFATREAVRLNVTENFEQTRPFVAHEDALGNALSEAQLRPVVSARAHAFLQRRALHFLEENEALFARRLEEGRIREGHGDLHGSNICFAPEGIAVYDCIEFSRRFRCGDVACELAFLAMDLDLRGFAGFARHFVRTYSELTGDPDLGRLMPFYKSYRAIVRGKVAALTAADAGVPASRGQELSELAMRYFQLAAAYELPPAVILMCGLPGTGKTWVARRLARPLNAVLLRSDVRRKVLAGMAPTTPSPEEYEKGLYAPEMKQRTYDSLLERMLAAIAEQRSVIVDASFSRLADRRLFIDAAARLGRPFFVVEVNAPEETVRQRLQARAKEANDASDADLAIYQRVRKDFEPPDEMAPGRIVRVHTERGCPETPGAELIDRMIALLHDQPL